MLQQGKIESAKIRVENIIRSDETTELLEILELYCELLLARTGLMEAKECDPGLEEAVKSIIYAAPRIEVKELQTVRHLLVEKYGKDFALEAVDNSDGKVADRVIKKLLVTPPEHELVHLYLEEIARTYGVGWPKRGKVKHESDDEDSDGGQQVKYLEAPLTAEELSRATPPRDLGPKSPVSIAPPSPSASNPSPRVKLPGPPDLKPGTKMNIIKNKKSNGGGGGGSVGGKIPDVDELSRRFAALKR